jgi:hypothetical protein
MKLTPVELSRKPIRIGVETQNYDFASQRRTSINSPLTVTYGGTQTHNNQGKPVDKDND